MSSRALLLVLAAAIAASLCAFVLERTLPLTAGRGGFAGRGDRIVSLSPALTDTLFSVGAGARVVGVSDYCAPPRETEERPLPRLGSGLSPSYERIAALGPTLILAETSSAPRWPALSAIAETHLLPWLGPGQVIEGIARVGALSGEAARGREVADRVAARLSRRPTDEAPRVLLAFGYGAIRTDELWFARPGSLHGTVLTAAGCRNAVQVDPPGPPQLPLERLFGLDPDIIIVLTDRVGGADAAVRSLSALHTLRATRTGRVRALTSRAAFSTGPRVVTLVDELAALLEELRRSR